MVDRDSAKFWPLKFAYDIGKVSKETIQMFKVAPDVLLIDDHSTVTWRTMGILLVGLRAVTEDVTQKALELESTCYTPYQGVTGGILLGLSATPATGCLWPEERHNTFFKSLRDWDERLRHHEAMYNQFGLANQDANAWDAMGERLLSGIYRTTDDKGEGRVIGTIPDFVQPFMLANQLVVQEQVMREWAASWFGFLAGDLGKAIEDILKKAAAVVGTVAGAGAGAYKAAKGSGGMIVLGVGVLGTMWLLGGRRR